MTKNYYAAQPYMGLNFTWDSPCWILHVFGNAKERDDYVSGDENRQCVSSDVACKIVGRKCIDDLRANVSHYEIERVYNRICIH